MKDIKPIFRNLEKMLRQSSWFDDGWEIYNRGAYMQLYKENWHNEAQGGIHFETYIEAREIKKKNSLFVCMQKRIVRRNLSLSKNFWRSKVTESRVGKAIEPLVVATISVSERCHSMLKTSNKSCSRSLTAYDNSSLALNRHCVSYKKMHQGIPNTAKDRAK